MSDIEARARGKYTLIEVTRLAELERERQQCRPHNWKAISGPGPCRAVIGKQCVRCGTMASTGESWGQIIEEAEKLAEDRGARSAFEIAAQRMTKAAAELSGDKRPETEKEKQWRLAWTEDAMAEWRKREAKQDE